MMKKIIFIFFAIAFACPAAYASIETDKTVGVCINYLVLLKKAKAANVALLQADNQARAMQFAKNEMADVEKLVNKGKWNKEAQTNYAMKGNSACRKIGIRPNDFQN